MKENMQQNQHLFHYFGYPDVELIGDTRQHSINLKALSWLEGLNMSITRPILHSAVVTFWVLAAGKLYYGSVPRSLLINLVIMAC